MGRYDSISSAVTIVSNSKFVLDIHTRTKLRFSTLTRLALASVLAPFGVHFWTFGHNYAVHFIVRLSTL